MKELYFENYKSLLKEPEEDTDESFCRKRMEMQMQRMEVWTQRGKERVGRMQKVALRYIICHV